jgi:hypothetical protein
MLSMSCFRRSMASIARITELYNIGKGLGFGLEVELSFSGKEEIKESC